MVEYQSLVVKYQGLVGEYEFWATVIAGFTLAVAIVGLYGLFRYVKATEVIAKATEQQGDVLSRPTISVLCLAADTPREKFSKVAAVIVNHSRVHSKIKVTIKAKLHVDGVGPDEEFLAPTPYDGKVWQFAAKKEFVGNFSFDGLKRRTITNKDTLTLIGVIESSAWWGQDDFRPDPPIVYHWDHRTQKWMPDF